MVMRSDLDRDGCYNEDVYETNGRFIAVLENKYSGKRLTSLLYFVYLTHFLWTVYIYSTNTVTI